MKADYKNWMPKGMVLGTLAVAVVFSAITAVVGISSIIGIVLLLLSVFSVLVTIGMFLMYRAFSYNGTRQMSRQIIEGVSSYVKIPAGGKYAEYKKKVNRCIPWKPGIGIYNGDIFSKEE